MDNVKENKAMSVKIKELSDNQEGEIPNVRPPHYWFYKKDKSQKSTINFVDKCLLLNIRYILDFLLYKHSARAKLTNDVHVAYIRQG